MANIFNILFNGINSAWTWFHDIMIETGLYWLVIGTVLIVMFWRMIIAPLFGGRIVVKSGSDKARKTPHEDKGGNQ